MKERILGIDTGTNSIGWSIVDYDCEAEENKYTLIDKGVTIFQEGVKIEKGIESSRAAERTGHRRLRIGYWRRKIRKIALLKILIKNNLCPPLTTEELKAWRSDKKYPLNEAFMQWQRTDEEKEKNPYFCRNLCITKKLDLQLLTNRYILGRAIYHINQRRGFLSNRKEDTKESNGEVKKGMDELTKSMQDGGMEYLGQYFYMLYQEKKKIRNRYTSRLEHYEKELLKICEMQDLSKELTSELRKTIITQRPLKSQKHSVGKCVFEPSKSRCPISHPLYEQYRMYAFLNNIKIRTPYDAGLRPLTEEEKTLIIPLFLRKSKKEFKFKEIAEKLAGKKKKVGYYKDKKEYDYRFRFQMDTSVSGCPVIAQLSEVFDIKNEVDEWLERACEVYTLARKKDGTIKNRYEIMDDIWHTLFFFEDTDKLKAWAMERLQLDEEHATMFSKIRIPSDYASLSLKAIRKILPYMKQYGMIYSHAVFMVNKYNLDGEGERKLKQLYHPSMIETFPKVLKPVPEGYFQLGSPRTNSLRNPMAMHSLFRLRHVINTLLKEGKINENTTIHIEFARELNNSNMRAAIRKWQKKREEKNNKYSVRIKELLGESYEPSENEILKYRLWEEQGYVSLYTGEKIKPTDLFDPSKYQIEHTIPRCVGGDFTDMNLTICESNYNHDIKKSQIPSQLANWQKILDIIEGVAKWGKKIEDLEKRKIMLYNRRKRLTDKKNMDDNAIDIHCVEFDIKYWKGKYERFTMTEVPEGFSRRQGVDISVISKYARLYLKSLFRNIYVVKGITTSEFRMMWGLQEEYTKKKRVNHCHHAVDAITIACIGKAEYDELAHYHREKELFGMGKRKDKPKFPKPWKTFTEDLKHIEDSLLVSHYTADNMGKQTRKRVRKDGKITNEFMQGDTARSSLHQDTYYGKIMSNGKEKCVIRRELSQIKNNEIDNIVDNVVRKKVREAIAQHDKNLKEAIKCGIWMNKEKRIPINKVRIYATPTAPLSIRKHRDVSTKEYKRTYYVVNDSNYIMGVYENTKGKPKFQLVNCLDATKHFNAKGQNEELLPLVKEGCPLRWKIKIGTMVFLYDKSPDEIYCANSKELCKCLYKVYALEKDGRIRLKHHQDARMAKEAKDEKSSFAQITEKGNRLRIRLSNFNALVEGQDFTMNDIGEITFLNHD